MKELVRYLLKNRMNLPIEDWTMQGFGFLRLRVDSNTRLHIWDARLRRPGVSDIHDHAQWAFTSIIISGSIINIRYKLSEGTPFMMATLQAGIGGGMKSDSTEEVLIKAETPELYTVGDSYRQEPAEVHRTAATDGTVTLISQERKATDTARVFWPKGSVWGDALPRQATEKEIEDVGGFALSIFPE